MTENVTFSTEVLFPDLSSTIREAASSGVREANPMTAPGGRIPRTDPETLAKINAPCATCGHSYLSHILESKQCFHCKPKGSNHRYHETPDLSPNLVQPPTMSGTASGEPENGITGLMRTGRLAEATSGEVEYEGAAERLMETIFSSAFPDVESNKAMADGDKALTLYNAHSTAAHRSSTMAYSGSGNNSAMHQVAAEHHRLAAEAANTAAGKVKSDKTKKDLATAAKYHSAQSNAHKAAAATQDSGNRQPYSYETSGHY